MRSLLLFAGISIFSSGCATIHPGMRASVFGTGVPDPDRDERVVAAAKTMKTAPSDVEIYAGKLPEGLDVTEGGSKITVAKGYDAQYQIIGTVESDYMKDLNSAVWKNLFWTWKYEEGWRKGLCYPQAPLKAATLSLWTYFVPLAWPCMASIPSKEEDRQKAHFAQLKKLAAAMGANLVVLTTSGDLSVTTVNAQTNQVVGHSVTKDMSLRGFAIKRAEPRAESKPAGEHELRRVVKR